MLHNHSSVQESELSLSQVLFYYFIACVCYKLYLYFVTTWRTQLANTALFMSLLLLLHIHNWQYGAHDMSRLSEVWWINKGIVFLFLCDVFPFDLFYVLLLQKPKHFNDRTALQV